MMVRPAAAFALPLTLAACAVEVPPETPPPPAAAYMALGTEPGWTLEITPDRLNYDGDYGETKIVVANPGARPSVNGERYVTDRLAVDVTHAECSDGMRSEEHTSELQSLMRISYAVFCLKKKKERNTTNTTKMTTQHRKQ